MVNLIFTGSGTECNLDFLKQGFFVKLIVLHCYEIVYDLINNKNLKELPNNTKYLHWNSYSNFGAQW